MWMIIVAAWLISLVGVALFVAGSKRQRDAGDAEDVALEQSLAQLHEDGRKSDVYYVGEASRAKRPSRSDANVA